MPAADPRAGWPVTGPRAESGSVPRSGRSTASPWPLCDLDGQGLRSAHCGTARARPAARRGSSGSCTAGRCSPLRCEHGAGARRWSAGAAAWPGSSSSLGREGGREGRRKGGSWHSHARARARKHTPARAPRRASPASTQYHARALARGAARNVSIPIPFFLLFPIHSGSAESDWAWKCCG
jgi:hypothetical protein